LNATGGNGEILATWDDLSGPTGYQVEYRLVTDLNYWTRAATAAADATSFRISSLANGIYHVRVGAVYAGGTEYSEFGSTVAVADTAKPTGVLYTAKGVAFIVEFTPAAVSGITSHSVEYVEKGSDRANAITQASVNSGDRIGGGTLKLSTTYEARVCAVGGTGECSDWADVTTTAGKPSGVTATGGVARIEVAWVRPDDAGVTGYAIWHRGAGGSTWPNQPQVTGINRRAESYTIRGLAEGDYDVRVSAVHPSPTGNLHGDVVEDVTVTLKKLGSVSAFVDDALVSARTVTVTFTAVSEAVDHRLQYRRKPDSRWFTRYAYIRRPFQLGNSSVGKTYSFRVCAVFWRSPLVTECSDSVDVEIGNQPTNLNVWPAART